MVLLDQHTLNSGVPDVFGNPDVPDVSDVSGVYKVHIVVILSPIPNGVGSMVRILLLNSGAPRVTGE